MEAARPAYRQDGVVDVAAGRGDRAVGEVMMFVNPELRLPDGEHELCMQ